MQVDGCQLRYERLADLREACTASPESWLTAAERVELARLQDEGRRTSWLAGRRLAKQTILELSGGRGWRAPTGGWSGKPRFVDVQSFTSNSTGEFNQRSPGLRKDSSPGHPVTGGAARSSALDSITILTRNELGQADRPRVTIDGVDFKLSLSISHSDRGVLVAIGELPNVEIGVDLCEEKLATTGFLATWYTEEERAALDNLPACEPTVFWAVKEAVYKACQRGESFKPRNIEISRYQDARYACHYEEQADMVHEISVDRIDGQIAVVVVAEKARIPLAV